MYSKESQQETGKVMTDDELIDSFPKIKLPSGAFAWVEPMTYGKGRLNISDVQSEFSVRTGF